MLIDWLIYGLLTWTLVALLNATLFKVQPASRTTAWVLTVAIFFVNLVAMTVLQYMRYQAISDSLGFKIKPHSPLDMTGAIIFSWLFFSLLRKNRKRAKVSHSIPEASATGRLVEPTSSTDANAGERPRAASVALQNAPQVETATTSEEELWSAAATELESPSRRPGLWAKAFAESQANEAIAKANYLKWRVAQLQNEETTRMQRIDEARRAKEEQTREAALAEQAKLYGICPSCAREILRVEVMCPHCRASIGPGSPYKILPLRQT